MSTNNMVKTVFLLALLTGLFVLVGRLVGGQAGMILAFAMALAMNFAAYWFSDSIALRMSGAKEVSEDEAPQLHQMVEELAGKAGIPKPRVHVIQAHQPNAFATGRDPAHGAVAVTSGIMQILTRDELAAVIAHELGHIRNRDTLIMTVVATLAGAITFLASMAQWSMIFGGGHSDDEEGGSNMIGLLATMIVAPIAATLVQLAISRSREFDADATGAQIAGNPLMLASALEKLEQGARQLPADVSPAAAHLFIVNPLSGQSLAGLFSTHPPVEERVARLRELATGRMPFASAQAVMR